MERKRIKNILVTGLPGCGKTTLLKRVLDGLPSDLPMAGFFTEELREGASRVGFGVVALDGRRWPLSHVRFDTGYRVGRYGVDVKGFERIIPQLLDTGGARIVVVDEIGKMECLSEMFRRSVVELLNAGPLVMGSIALKSEGFIAGIRARKDLEIIQVTSANRDRLAPIIIQKVAERLKTTV